MLKTNESNLIDDYMGVLLSTNSFNKQWVCEICFSSSAIVSVVPNRGVAGHGEESQAG